MLVAVGDAKSFGLRLLVYACLGLCERRKMVKTLTSLSSSQSCSLQ
uniref:Uncharacterized protein n=1 Tax=Parascaris equorum TaxID=6256 RepID=A0A914S651_PAREQ